MALKLINTTLAADLVGGGTLVLSYPAGTSKGNFSGSLKHKLATVMAGNIFGSPAYFTITYSATTFTINWTVGSPTIPAGTQCVVQLDEPGYNASESKSPFPELFNVIRGGLILVNFGSPATADADGVSVAQAVAAPGNATITGALAANGVATMDVPRTLQAVSSNAGDTTQTLTVTGTDVYGVAMVETIALNGTTIVQGVKAFKTVTRVAVSAALVGNLTVGSSTRFGFPVFLPGVLGSHVLKELFDGGAVTNGTYVVGSTAKPTATTGDVRGLYSPNSAADGTRTYEVILALPDPDFLGQTQYSV